MKAKRPVKDIKIEAGMTVDNLMVQLRQSGGFTGRKLAEAVDIMEKMVRKEGCTTFLSFPACIMATGTRGVIVEMVKRGMVDVDHHHLRDHGPRSGTDLEELLPWGFPHGRRQAAPARA